MKNVKVEQKLPEENINFEILDLLYQIEDQFGLRFEASYLSDDKRSYSVYRNSENLFIGTFTVSDVLEKDVEDLTVTEETTCKRFSRFVEQWNMHKNHFRKTWDDPMHIQVGFTCFTCMKRIRFPLSTKKNIVKKQIDKIYKIKGFKREKIYLPKGFPKTNSEIVSEIVNSNRQKVYHSGDNK